MNPTTGPTTAHTSPNGDGSELIAGAPTQLPADSDEVAQVMFGYQELMAKFLDTQHAVMMSYLSGDPGAAPIPAAPGSNGAVNRFAPMPPAAASDPNIAPAPVEAPPVERETAIDTAAAPSDNGHAIESTNGNQKSEIENPKSEEAASEPQSVALDRESLTAQLLDLVSERTGYPKDMLDIDLDLEGDLGIDSIKRVEILGSLAESIGASDDGGDLQSKLELEKLTSIRNLRGILEYLEAALFADDSAASPAGANNGSSAKAASPSRNGDTTNGQPQQVRRGLVRLVDSPLPAGASMMIPSGAVLVTDDGRGIARELADRLADFGQKLALVRMTTEGNGQQQSDVLQADLRDEVSVSKMLQQAREQLGPIAGLIHLLPLAAVEANERPEDRASRDVKSLYLLARAMQDEMCEAGANGNAFLLAPTSLGGDLGYGDGPLPESYVAGHGGILGFVKCLGMEWPDVLVRGVDLDSGRPVAESVDAILGELGDSQGPLEIGHSDGRRVTWEPLDAPLDDNAEAVLDLQPGATVLITGGARGITAAIAKRLAKQWQPRLILVGRSEAPDATEDAETRDLTSAAEIKAALIARSQREGRPPAPARIESAYKKLMADREIRDNLARIQEAGSEVHYDSVDVRDEQALTELISEIEKRFGGIDGVIHGAGVIEDKLVRDKTPASFDRVFSTKVNSAMTLRRHLNPESLKFCVFFASIASRYGNRGQADYAAANEVLSKLAIELDRQWPCRVVSVAWGPWAGLGMVSDLERHLTERGITLISPEEGPRFLLEELSHGRKGQSEVLIGGGAEHLVQPHASEAVAAS